MQSNKEIVLIDRYWSDLKRKTNISVRKKSNSPNQALIFQISEHQREDIKIGLICD